MLTYYSRPMLLLCGLLLLAMALPAAAEDSFPIKVYPCPQADTAPVMDGKLDDAVWQKAPLVSGFTNFGTDKLADVQTSFRVLWDEKNLYLGLQCDEPQMDKLSPVRYAHDEHAVFSNETIELFIDPNHTHDLYYQLAFNVAGSLYDGERESTAWNSQAQVAPHIGAGFWSVEIAVPWAPMKALPRVGRIVGFNVCRDRNIGDKAWTNWARVMDGFHDPQRFAHLVLSGTPDLIAALSAEFRKGGRTGAITVYSAEGFAETSYAKLAQVAFGDVTKLLNELETEAGKEKDPAAGAKIRQRVTDFRAKLGTLKTQSEGKLDAAQWIRLDLELQGMMVALSRTVWEARLTALLEAI